MLLVKPVAVLFLGWSAFILLAIMAWWLKTFYPTGGVIILLLDIVLILAVHHFFFILFIEWMISSVIVTTRQIIDLRFLSFMEDDVMYIEIEEIHEIEKKKHGFLRNLLNYGDITIDLSGKPEPVELTYVRHPGYFAALIESVKYHKPLEGFDLKSMGAECSERYRYLMKKKKKE